MVCNASMKGGFGGTNSSDKTQPNQPPKPQQSPKAQQPETQLLAKLVEASDPASVARENVAGLTQQFFMIASTFMSMAQKEGNKEMAARLETALTAAWQEKQQTMRPELRLLNQLCRMHGPGELSLALSKTENQEVLAMNERYFFEILEKMITDVGRQPANPNQAQLLTQLQDIKREALAVRPA